MSTPISEAVARIMCPEAFHARDEFEQAMERLACSTGASGDDVDRLQEQVLQLANTTGLSVAGAADHLAAQHALSGALGAITPSATEGPAVTDILASIDDTLADWHGSADAMRWRPEAEQGDMPVVVTRDGHLLPLTVVLTADVDAFTAAFRRLAEGVSRIWLAMEPLIAARQPPRPSFLDARYHQRQRNRRKRR